MLQSARLPRTIAILLLSNLGLIGLAVMWRHADAQESPPVSVPAAEAHESDALAPKVPTAELAGPELKGPELKGPALTGPAIELPPATTTAPRGVSPDFVLDEIKKAIQDPNSGLSVPPLEYPSLGLARENTQASLDPTQVARSDGDNPTSNSERLRLRLNSIAQLANAATALAEEAELLARSGERKETELLWNQVAQLRKCIARLAENP